MGHEESNQTNKKTLKNYVLSKPVIPFSSKIQENANVPTRYAIGPQLVSRDISPSFQPNTRSLTSIKPDW